LTKLHDVNAVLTEGQGPSGGAGVAATGLDLQLDEAGDLLLLGKALSGSLLAGDVRCDSGVLTWGRPSNGSQYAVHSDLGDLETEREFDRCLAAEDRDQHLELLALGD